MLLPIIIIIRDKPLAKPVGQGLPIVAEDDPLLVVLVLYVAQFDEYGGRGRNTYKLRSSTVPENPRPGWWRLYLREKVDSIVLAKRLLA